MSEINTLAKGVIANRNGNSGGGGDGGTGGISINIVDSLPSIGAENILYVERGDGTTAVWDTEYSKYIIINNYGDLTNLIFELQLQGD